LYKAFESFLVAFNDQSKEAIIRQTGFTKQYVESQVKTATNLIANDKIVDTLVPVLKQSASGIIKKYEDLTVPVLETK
jgi:hypothetical protein